MSRCLFLALCATAAFARPAVAQQYQVSETIPVSGASGTPSGVAGWWVSGVNSSGLVVGCIDPSTGSRAAYVWSAAGSAAPLTLPTGYVGCGELQVNSQGWIAGTSYTEFGKGTPTIWKNGTATAIAVPGEVDSMTTALSNAGHVAGITGLDRPGAPRGFVWHDGTFTNLSSLGLGGGGMAVATAVNGGGLAFGYSETATNVMTATKWVNGTPTDLGVAGSFSTVKDVNEAGNIVVGAVDSNAFIIRDGEIEYLSAPSGALSIQARAVNATGDVVGTIYYQDPHNRTEAFLYRDGQLIRGVDLFGVPGVTQSEGLEVTDDGRVFVMGLDSQSRQTVFELTLSDGEVPPGGDDGGNNGSPPGVPEPATAVLLGIAGLGAAGWRRWRR